MRNILLPQIQSRFNESSSSKNQKTVIDLAIKDLKESGYQPTPRLMNIIVANLKVFLFAGHDTTAQTLLVLGSLDRSCFTLLYLANSLYFANLLS